MAKEKEDKQRWDRKSDDSKRGDTGRYAPNKQPAPSKKNYDSGHPVPPPPPNKKK